jgi:hypothetical protein
MLSSSQLLWLGLFSAVLAACFSNVWAWSALMFWLGAGFMAYLLKANFISNE